MESSYPEMQRNIIPRVYENQFLTAATQLMIDIKHQPVTVLVDI